MMLSNMAELERQTVLCISKVCSFKIVLRWNWQYYSPVTCSQKESTRQDRIHVYSRSLKCVYPSPFAVIGHKRDFSGTNTDLYAPFLFS
ncbi:hypothetical protein P692DRAFT_20293615 [Suillus brevipes Sb2]|nr:hypothetical protein P692DRAFT_20293615 [Suillus brevipes Sb2]